ncbi:11115_t:CDS:1, partial [Acaulospora colombiana]
FPPEKVGLSPPPPKRRGSKDSIRKKPLPLGDNERERKDIADKTDTPTTMHTNTVTTPSYTTHNTNTTGSYYSSPPPPHTPPTR